MPEAFAKRFVQFFQMVKDGDYARVLPVLETLLKRPDITLKQFIADYRGRFILYKHGISNLLKHDITTLLLHFYN